jgi:hypothetical protein
MQRFEYKVIPAPQKGEKAKGAKTTPERFAVALTSIMNKLGAEGWEYVRADTLPCDERVGLTGTKTSFQNMLVFRRAIAQKIDPEMVAPSRKAPVAAAPETQREAVPAPLLQSANSGTVPNPELAPNPETIAPRTSLFAPERGR